MPPLAVRMRPRSLEEVGGQGDVLRPGAAAPAHRGERGSGRTDLGDLWEPPGTGKTTLAHLVATAAEREFIQLSAVTAGVKDVRTVMERAARARDMYGARPCCSSTRSTGSPRPSGPLLHVENRPRSCSWRRRRRTPPSRSIAPLLSLSMLVALLPLSDEDVTDVLRAAVSDERGLAGAYRLEDEARDHLVRLAGGDARQALTFLEAAAGVAEDAVPPGAERPRSSRSRCAG